MATKMKIHAHSNYYCHYTDVYRAISGDLIALARIEQAYGKIDSLGDLHDLGSKLFNLLTDEEREMSLTQVTLTLHKVDDTTAKN